MSNTAAMRASAGLGFLAVALGAFGAHALKHILESNGTAEIWRTAVLYHFIHAIMLYVVASRSPLAAGPWWCFALGIVAFSGSLYALSLVKWAWLGPVTPIGGASFLAGWFWLAINAGKPGARPE